MNEPVINNIHTIVERRVTGFHPLKLPSITKASRIIVSELITGAITGPIQMTGIRNKMSVVRRDAGHPSRSFRHT